MLDHQSPDMARYRDEFNARFILAETIEPSDFDRILLPFEWYRHADRFIGLNFEMRGATSRLLALVPSEDVEATRYTRRTWLEAAQLMDGYAQRGEISVLPHQDPLSVIQMAARSALKAIDGRDGSILDVTPAMKGFHEGWRDAVADEVLDKNDADSFQTLADDCAALLQLKSTVHNLVRSDPIRQAARVEEVIHELLPVDQCDFLHALGAASKAAVLRGFFDRYMGRTPHEYCRKEAHRVSQRLVRVKTARQLERLV